MTRKFVARLLAGTCGLLLPVAGWAQAAPSPEQSAPAAQPAVATPADARSDDSIPEIVVTARRREENLQRVPLAVTALDSTRLANAGVTSLANLATGIAPGLVIYKSAGLASQVSINIRGVTVADPGQGTADAGVAVYIDGVFLGRAQGLGMDLGEPERVEILRGPQGTLFGRNAEGGAIQIVTKKPTGKFDADIAGTIGNFAQRRLVAHVDLPSIAGIALKFDGLVSVHDGFVKNAPRDLSLTDQSDFSYQNDKGFRVSARANPASNLTLDYSFDWSKSIYTSQYYLWRSRTGVPLGGRPVDPDRVDTSWMPIWMAPLQSKSTGHAFVASLDVARALTIKSITSYRTLDDGGFNQTGGSVSFTPQAGVAIPGHPGLLSYGRSGLLAGAFLNQNQFSQELQLTGTSGRMQYTAGLYYYHEAVTDTRITEASLYYLAPGPSMPTSLNPVTIAQPNVNHAATRSYAAYAQATWQPPILSDRLNVTLGLRYTNDDKKIDRTVASGVTLATPLTGAFKASRVDPAATLQFNFSDNTNIYLRYATGYRAGGVAVRSPTFRAYGEETSRMWEFGFKASVGRRIRFNAALFSNIISGFQVSSQPDPVNNPSLTDYVNDPKDYKIRGVETELTVVPFKGLNLQAAYSYSDESNPSYSVSGIAVPITFPNVPKHTGSLSIDYTPGTFSFGKPIAHLDWSVSSGFYRPNIVTPAQAIGYYEAKIDAWNGRIGLTEIPISAATKVNISLFVRNIFNNADVLFSAPSGGVIPADPRTFGVELRVKL